MTQIANTTAYVCDSFTTVAGDREFKTIQEVLTNAGFNSEIFIKLMGDIPTVPKFNLSTTSVVNIDGGDQFGITFTGDIVTIGSGQTLKFSNMSYIDGGKIELNIDNTNVHFTNCENVDLAHLSMEMVEQMHHLSILV